MMMIIMRMMMILRRGREHTEAKRQWEKLLLITFCDTYERKAHPMAFIYLFIFRLFIQDSHFSVRHCYQCGSCFAVLVLFKAPICATDLKRGLNPQRWQCYHDTLVRSARRPQKPLTFVLKQLARYLGHLARQSDNSLIKRFLFNETRIRSCPFEIVEIKFWEMLTHQQSNSIGIN